MIWLSVVAGYHTFKRSEKNNFIIIHEWISKVTEPIIRKQLVLDLNNINTRIIMDQSAEFNTPLHLG